MEASRGTQWEIPVSIAAATGARRSEVLGIRWKDVKRLLEKAKLPPNPRLHDVRHGVATALLGAGVHPAIASAVLGHASPSFTMSQYQHVLDGMTDVAAAALEAALGGSAPRIT